MPKQQCALWKLCFSGMYIDCVNELQPPRCRLTNRTGAVLFWYRYDI